MYSEINAAPKSDSGTLSLESCAPGLHLPHIRNVMLCEFLVLLVEARNIAQKRQWMERFLRRAVPRLPSKRSVRVCETNENITLLRESWGPYTGIAS